MKMTMFAENMCQNIGYREREVTYSGDPEPSNMVSLADGLYWLPFNTTPSSVALADSGEPWKLTAALLEDTPANIMQRSWALLFASSKKSRVQVT